MALGCTGDWRGTVGLRGRRKPVPGGLAAASMPRTPRKPTVPRLRQFPGDGGTHFVESSLLNWWFRSDGSNGERRREMAASTRSARPAFDFLFLFRGWQHTETIRGRAGWVRGGVRGMDAAAKPPRTGSRRPPRTHPARPSAAFALRGQAASHEGLRRWLKTQYRLIPGTVQPSICACADTAFSFSPRARRDCSIVAQ